MFIDIETVPVVKNFSDLDDRGKALFCQRFEKHINERQSEQIVWVEHAALYAEFARVICVTVGIRTSKKEGDSEKVEFRIKSVADRDEKISLLKLSEILLRETHLSGHNIKAFDIPFLLRRYIINNLPVPTCLQVMGRKSWEIPHDDTMEMWACGDFNGKISLDRLAYALGLSSPKTEISGADVGPLWYSDGIKDELPFDRDERVLKIISRYCSGDVLTQANCYYRMKGLPIIKPESIVYVE